MADQISDQAPRRPALPYSCARHHRVLRGLDAILPSTASLSPFWIASLSRLPSRPDAIVNQLMPCRNMPCHRATHTSSEQQCTLRPAVTAASQHACTHTPLPGNYSWAREPVGFCRPRVEPSCHVPGVMPDATHTHPMFLPARQRPKPCACSRLTSQAVPSWSALTEIRTDGYIYTLPASACRSGSQELSRLRRGSALPPPQPLLKSRLVQQGYRFSQFSPSL